VFLGKFSRTVNQRNRFPVPPQFKDELAGGAYLTQGFDRNLQVLTARAFQDLYERMRSLNIADPVARGLLRLILGTAQELKADGQNSVQIPAELKDFAGLQQDVFLVGQGDYFEIWSPDLWAAQEAELKDAKSNASRFSALTVTIR
jgi:MraZ protein